ncbi:MAG TPA: hypothetical protein VNA25_19600 [Phycisphaerae bacterium]|nr:hypothetical protein [Phycisphaerae bacterium]
MDPINVFEAERPACPFCKAPAVMECEDDGVTMDWTLKCQKMACPVKPKSRKSGTAERAIAAIKGWAAVSRSE